MSDWLTRLSAEILRTFRLPETILDGWRMDSDVEYTFVRVDADGNWYLRNAEEPSEENPTLNVTITVKKSTIVDISVNRDSDDYDRYIAEFGFYPDGSLKSYDVEDWGRLSISDTNIHMWLTLNKTDYVELKIEKHQRPEDAVVINPVIWGHGETTEPIPYEWLIGRSITRMINPELIPLIPARVYGNGVPVKLRLYDESRRNILIWPEFHYFAEKTADGEIQTTTHYKLLPGTELAVDK